MEGLLLEENLFAGYADCCVDPVAILPPPIAGPLPDTVDALRRQNLELRQQVGYWKSTATRALQRLATREQERNQLRDEQRQRMALLEQQAEQLRGDNRRLQDQIFGTKSEKHSAKNRANRLDGETDDDEPARPAGPPKPRRGPQRRDRSALPVRAEIIVLPADECRCPNCGEAFLTMTATEDAEPIEIDVQAYRRLIRRRRYRKTCACPETPTTITAPVPPKLIPKSL